MWEVHGNADLHKAINENADKAAAVHQVELGLNLSAQKSQYKSTCPYLILLCTKRILLWNNTFFSFTINNFRVLSLISIFSTPVCFLFFLLFKFLNTRMISHN